MKAKFLPLSRAIKYGLFEGAREAISSLLYGAVHVNDIDKYAGVISECIPKIIDDLIIKNDGKDDKLFIAANLFYIGAKFLHETESGFERVENRFIEYEQMFYREAMRYLIEAGECNSQLLAEKLESVHLRPLFVFAKSFDFKSLSLIK